ncbi:MAG: DUF3592 domain-containing protein [Betaproteobacteria bacterium]
MSLERNYWRFSGLLLTAMMLGLSSHMASEDRAYRLRGVKVAAELPRSITQLTTTTKKLGIELSREISYDTDLTFVATGQGPISFHHRLSDAELRKVRAGEPIMVEYLPEAVREVRVVGEHGHPVWALLAGLLLGGLTVALWNRRAASE